MSFLSNEYVILTAITVGILIAGFILWQLVALFLFREKRMQAAYREYESLERSGKTPCIVCTLWGPEVIPSYPAMMRTNMIWGKNADGNARPYETTTPVRLMDAGYYA